MDIKEDCSILKVTVKHIASCVYTGQERLFYAIRSLYVGVQL